MEQNTTDIARHRRRELWLALALIGLVVLVCCGGCGFLYWQRTQRAEEYQLPADYRGWVIIRYEEPGCLPLPQRGFTTYFPIDATGRVCTSTKIDFGFIKRRYVLVAADGGRQEIVRGWELDRHGPEVFVWYEGAHKATLTDRYVGDFFVGTTEDSRHTPAQPLP